MNNSLLRVEHVTISYNGKPVVSDVSFELESWESPAVEKVRSSRQSWAFWEKKVWLPEAISGIKEKILQR